MCRPTLLLAPYRRLEAVVTTYGLATPCRRSGSSLRRPRVRRSSGGSAASDIPHRRTRPRVELPSPNVVRPHLKRHLVTIPVACPHDRSIQEQATQPNAPALLDDGHHDVMASFPPDDLDDTRFSKVALPRDRHHHYEPAVKCPGLGHVRFHDLRHTCAALLIAAGRHLRGGQDVPRALVDPRHERSVRTPLPRSARRTRGRARRDVYRIFRGPAAAPARNRAAPERGSAASKGR